MKIMVVGGGGREHAIIKKLKENPELTEIYARLNSAAKETGNNEFTFASYDPKCQIDYIFVPKTAKIKSCTVHKVMTSDHRPLTAEIEF